MGECTWRHTVLFSASMAQMVIQDSVLDSVLSSSVRNAANNGAEHILKRRAVVLERASGSVACCVTNQRYMFT